MSDCRVERSWQLRLMGNSVRLHNQLGNGESKREEFKMTMEILFMCI